jgi:selenium-binding protein 1
MLPGTRSFYPGGVGAWLAKLDANTEAGGLAADERFFPHDYAFRGLDSYCFTE